MLALGWYDGGHSVAGRLPGISSTSQQAIGGLPASYPRPRQPRASVYISQAGVQYSTVRKPHDIIGAPMGRRQSWSVQDARMQAAEARRQAAEIRAEEAEARREE